jgi:hypothetical protein
MIDNQVPKGEGLYRWMAEKGWDEAEEYTHMRAEYGTMMHIVFEKLLINKQIDLDDLDTVVSTTLAKHELSPHYKARWSEDLKKDVLAFAQWIKDYNVRPIIIEAVLASDLLGVAGATDLGCWITIPTKGFWGEVYKSGPRKGEPKETKKDVDFIAIVDFKSGRKGFGIENKFQLATYKRLVEENFPELMDKTEQPIRLFNWSPKSWRTDPGYNFTDQEDLYVEEKLSIILQGQAIDDKYSKIGDKPIKFYTGQVVLGEQFDSDANILSMTVREAINEGQITEKPDEEGLADNREY